MYAVSLNVRVVPSCTRCPLIYALGLLPGQVDREEEARKAPPKDYYNPAAGGEVCVCVCVYVCIRVCVCVCVCVFVACVYTI